MTPWAFSINPSCQTGELPGEVPRLTAYPKDAAVWAELRRLLVVDKPHGSPITRAASIGRSSTG